MCPACDGWAVERGTVATGRMRVSVALTVAGAVLLMVGVITVLVGEAMRLKSPHGWQGTVGLGKVVAACGLGCGLALLAAVAAGRPRRRRTAAGSRSAPRARSEGRPRSAPRTLSEGTPSSEGASGSAATWRPASRSASLAGSAANPVSGTVMGPGPAGWAGPAARPGRSDRARHQSQPEYAWDGGAEDAWRRDAADEWLSPLRNPGAAHAPEPTRWSGEPIQEFSPALDYSDDGWRPESAAGYAAEPRPPQLRPPEPRPPRPRPPEPPVRPRGGAHRATGATAPQARYETGPQPAYQTGPQPAHPTDRESGQAISPSPLPASAATGIGESADTTPLTVIMASRPLPVPAPPAQAKLDQIKDLYLTAEAIGEDALIRHFEEVSNRQRDLIRQYFEQSGFGQQAAARVPGDDPAQN
jgi:hypothetical protein